MNLSSKNISIIFATDNRYGTLVPYQIQNNEENIKSATVLPAPYRSGSIQFVLIVFFMKKMMQYLFSGKDITVVPYFCVAIVLFTSKYVDRNRR